MVLLRVFLLKHFLFYLQLQGYCLIFDHCYEDGYVPIYKSGLSNCQYCNTSLSNSSFSWLPTGGYCNDTVYCNGADSCLHNSTTGYSSCSIHTGNPCTGSSNPCNDTCDEDAANCFTVLDNEPCTNAPPTSCWQENLCNKGTCLATDILPPPNCTGCPCAGHTVCNQTTGICQTAPASSSTPWWEQPAFHGALGGTVASLACFALLWCYVKRRQSQFAKQTLYHKLQTDGEGPIEINKGL